MATVGLGKLDVEAVVDEDAKQVVSYRKLADWLLPPENFVLDDPL